ncbi:MAG: cupin domain-containing protein [Promethearchaeota archaeon]|jgi:quercetin dioxygenase-like cupin family protein
MPAKIRNKKDVQPTELLEGVYRRTLVYDNNLMICHFTLKKNAKIPLHNHKEHQIGYMIKGKLQFTTEHDEFLCKEGDSYIFESNEKHGALVLEDSEAIDVFNPAREDYK